VLIDDQMETLRGLAQETIPLPGAGTTAERHRRLFEIGRIDLSLARLAEAHWDAVAILAESGREARADCIYGVWASERPGQQLTLVSSADSFRVNGQKAFCSGAGLIDRALVTVGGIEQRLVDIDLRRNTDFIQFDRSAWKTNAFRETRTDTATFDEVRVSATDLIGEPDWYLQRPGFWHGACGPAACWAGGAAALVDYAERQSREDPHTVAHLGAMHASIWAVLSYLDSAGHQIDACLEDREQALIRALTVRHLVEQACTEVLRRLPRAYGPHPLAMDEDVLRRYQELDLYIRQSHAERDLETLGRTVLASLGLRKRYLDRKTTQYSASTSYL
jgi:alkylation response protein AidB-like acyl-CoA dehydrogenase